MRYARRSRLRTFRCAIGLGLMVAGTIAGLGGGASAQDGEDGVAPRVVGLRLVGVVDPFIADYVVGGIDGAEAEGADAVLLTIDTPGGLDSSMRKIIQSILGSRVPVVCYVSPQGARAASAGTFILLSCPVAAMAPGTNVGAAHPVGVAGAIEQQKVTEDAVAYIRGLAEARGRNADWAERAVRESVSLSAEEALQNDVIDVIAPNTVDLLRTIDGRTVESPIGQNVVLNTAGATVEESRLGLGVALLHALLSPDLAFILFYLGIGLIVIEILHPGVSVPGIAGVLCLIGAFVTFGMLPVQIVGIALLLASAVFFLLELKHPGLGAASVGGVVTLVAGGLLLFDPSVPNARVHPLVILPVAGFLVLFFATVVNVALKARQLPVATGPGVVIGSVGTVTTDLDPHGVVQLSSESWSAKSEGGTLPRGARVRVTGVEGLRLKVEPVDEVTPAGPGSGKGGRT